MYCNILLYHYNNKCKGYVTLARWLGYPLAIPAYQGICEYTGEIRNNEHEKNQSAI